MASSTRSKTAATTKKVSSPIIPVHETSITMPVYDNDDNDVTTDRQNQSDSLPPNVNRSCSIDTVSQQQNQVHGEGQMAQTDFAGTYLQCDPTTSESTRSVQSEASMSSREDKINDHPNTAELNELRQTVSVLTKLVINNQTSRRSTSGLKFPTFNGEAGENLAAFLNQAETNFRFLHWSDEEKTEYIPLILAGRAGIFYDSLDNSTKSNYSVLITALKDKFGLKNNFLHQSKLLDQKQGEEETVAAYSREFLCNMQQLEITDEPTILRHYLRGMRPSIRSTVLLHRPQTMSEAEELAQMVENQQAETSPRNEGLANSIDELKSLVIEAKSSIFATKTVPADQNINYTTAVGPQQQQSSYKPFCRRCYTAHEWGKHVQIYTNHPPPPTINSTKPNHGNQQIMTSQPQMPRSNQPRQGQCYRCGQWGHFARECRVTIPLN